jgi:hypothetical protein
VASDKKLECAGRGGCVVKYVLYCAMRCRWMGWVVGGDGGEATVRDGGAVIEVLLLLLLMLVLDGRKSQDCRIGHVQCDALLPR